MRLRPSLYRYRLPLLRPLLLGTHTIDHREGLIVRLLDDSGHEAHGEIAPLPYCSREKLSDALAQTQLVLKELSQREWPDSTIDDWQRSELFSRLDSLYHSVGFGLSTAVLQLAALQQSTELHTLMDATSPDSVSVNALLTGGNVEILERARTLNSQGFRVAKLKVGTNSISDDIDLIRNVSRIFDSGVSLRLDANRRWTLEQAVECLTADRDNEIEYIEEPVNNLRRLPELHNFVSTRVALDESLPEYFATGMQARFIPNAVIVKPTLSGGWGRCLNLHHWAQEKHVKLVVSSSFESAVGLRTLASLAAVISADTACGLDTSSWFSQDLIDGGLPIKNGQCSIRELSFDWSSIHSDLLTEVPLG